MNAEATALVLFGALLAMSPPLIAENENIEIREHSEPEVVRFKEQSLPSKVFPTQRYELVAHVARTLGIDHAGFDLAGVDGQFNVLFGNEALTLHGIRLGLVIHAYLADRADDPDRPLWPEAC